MAEVIEFHKNEAPTQEAPTQEAPTQEAPTQEAPVNPFPAKCAAKYPVIDVLGLVLPNMEEAAITDFLKAHDMEVEFSSKTVHQNGDGFIVLKAKDLPNTTIVPFGMFFAIAEGVKDFMVIHPQVMEAFYVLQKPVAQPSNIDGGVLQ